MTTDKNLINLTDADLDQPIYRIYPIDRFEEMITNNEDALVNPRKWEDPFENFFLERTEVMDNVSGSAIPLKNLADDWYGQCWSLHDETDAMWRIYSSDFENNPGVKVQSTIRRLFDNLCQVSSSAPYLQYFIGKVKYFSENDRYYVANTPKLPTIHNA